MGWISLAGWKRGGKILTEYQLGTSHSLAPFMFTNFFDFRREEHLCFTDEESKVEGS